MSIQDVAPLSLQVLSTQRRHLGIWVLKSWETGHSIDALFAAKYGFRKIDMLIDLMVQLTDESDKPLGVFGPDDLAAWIMRESYKTPTLPLILNEIEPLFSTFGKLQTIAFLRLAKELDPRSPVIIASRMGDLVSAAGFPGERIWIVSA